MNYEEIKALMKTRTIKGMRYCLCEILAVRKQVTTTAWLPLNANGDVWEYISRQHGRCIDRKLGVGYWERIRYRIAGIDDPYLNDWRDLYYI